MTVNEYARLHGLKYETARMRMRGARARNFLAPKLPAIRAHLAAGEKHEWIALEVGCSRCMITLIANGKRHKDTK